MTDDERIATIRGGRWIRYARVEQIARKLDELLLLPKTHRMPNLLIVGETNNGKTALLTRFLAQHRPQVGGEEAAASVPIVAVQAPPLPDERRFYQAILDKVFAPFRPSKTAGNLQFEVVQLLSAVGVKMLVIDEVHHVLADAQAAALPQRDQVFGQRAANSNRRSRHARRVQCHPDGSATRQPIRAGAVAPMGNVRGLSTTTC